MPQRNSLSMVTILWCLAFCSSSGFAADANEPPHALVEAVQSILGLSSKGPDLLHDAPDDVLRELPEKRVRHESLDTFAAALVQNGDLTCAAKLAAAHTELDKFPEGYRKNKDWPYPTWGELGTLSGLLYQRAKQADDPKIAATNAKAALLVAATTEYNVDQAILASVLAKPDLEKLAGLTPDQLKQLKAVVDAENKRTGAVLSAPCQDAYEKHDLLITSNGPLDGATLQKCLAWAIEARKAFTNRKLSANNDNYNLVQFTWDLLNLAYLRKDQAALTKVEDFIKAWQRDEGDPNVRRWLTEALEIRSDKLPLRCGDEKK